MGGREGGERRKGEGGVKGNERGEKQFLSLLYFLFSLLLLLFFSLPLDYEKFIVFPLINN